MCASAPETPARPALVPAHTEASATAWDASAAGDYHAAARAFADLADASSEPISVGARLRQIGAELALGNPYGAATRSADLAAQARGLDDPILAVVALAVQAETDAWHDDPAAGLHALSEAIDRASQLHGDPRLTMVRVDLARAATRLGVADLSVALLRDLLEGDGDDRHGRAGVFTAIGHLIVALDLDGPGRRAGADHAGALLEEIIRTVSIDAGTARLATAARAFAAALTGDAARALASADVVLALTDPAPAVEVAVIARAARVIASEHVGDTTGVLADHAVLDPVQVPVGLDTVVATTDAIALRAALDVGEVARARSIADGLQERLSRHGRQRRRLAGQYLHQEIAGRRSEALSLRDPLTGLANRRLLDQVIDRALSQGTQTALAVVDLDDFKAINDGIGYEAGDAVLKQLASVLEQACRRQDVVARFGGDEFVVVLPGASSATAERVLNRLLERLRDHRWEGLPEPTRLTASVGVTVWDPGTVDVGDDLIARAGEALRRAKQRGRDRLVCWVADPDA